MITIAQQSGFSQESRASRRGRGQGLPIGMKPHTVEGKLGKGRMKVRMEGWDQKKWH